MRVLSGIAGVSVLLMMLSCADRPPDCHDDTHRQPPGRVSDGSMLQNEFLDKGLHTDTCSLVSAVWSNNDKDVRWKAVKLLGCSENPAARQALTRALKRDKDDFVRKVAAETLAGCGDAEGKNTVRILIKQSDQLDDQAFMASTLAEGGDPSGYEFAARLARSDKAYQRVQSTAFLYPFFRYAPGQLAISQPGPDELLKSLLADQDAGVRRVAVNLTNSVVGIRYRAMDDYSPVLEKMGKRDADAQIRERCKLLLKSWKSEKKRLDATDAKSSNR